MDEHFQIRFGVPDEWNHFAKGHSLFVERFDNLKSAIGICFDRTLTSADVTDKVMFLLGRLSAEDFQEVLLLCANGFGSGAFKILRVMYERVVTARWLRLQPQETELFVNYDWVQKYKLRGAICRTFGEQILPTEAVENAEANYNQVKDQFQVTDCGKCGTKKINHTWSKLDFVSMAGKVGNVGQYIVPGYYIPLRETHPSFGAILSRWEKSEDGGVGWDGGRQHKWAEQALMTAHYLMLNMLDLQKEHFELQQLEGTLKQCENDITDIWKKS